MWGIAKSSRRSWEGWLWPSKSNITFVCRVGVVFAHPTTRGALLGPPSAPPRVSRFWMIAPPCIGFTSATWAGFRAVRARIQPIHHPIGTHTGPGLSLRGPAAGFRERASEAGKRQGARPRPPDRHHHPGDRQQQPLRQCHRDERPRTPPPPESQGEAGSSTHRRNK